GGVGLVDVGATALELARDGDNGAVSTFKIASAGISVDPLPFTVEFSTPNQANVAGEFTRLRGIQGFPTDFAASDLAGPVLILSLSVVTVGSLVNEFLGGNLTIFRFGSNPRTLLNIFRQRAQSGVVGDLQNFFSVLFLQFPGVIGATFGTA